MKIIEHSKVSRSATIVTLGDYVDRGPKSRQIIERLMDWMSPDLTLICLKGNHEDMMWHCCRHPIRAGWWMENGGGATMVSYGQREGEPVDVTVVPEQHLRWMDELPTMHLDRHRVYVHAGVNPDLPLDAPDPAGAFVEALQGRRRPAWSRHAACRAWPSSIQERPDYDRRPNQPRHACLAHWQAGCRSFLDDDVPGGPVSLLEVRGEPVETKPKARERA